MAVKKSIAEEMNLQMFVDTFALKPIKLKLPLTCISLVGITLLSRSPPLDSVPLVWT